MAIPLGNVRTLERLNVRTFPPTLPRKTLNVERETFERSVHPELRGVGRTDFGFWNLDFGFSPAPDWAADTATAAESSDGASLQRQRSEFVEDTGSIFPVDQSPGHCSYVIKGLECFVSPRSIDGTGMAEKT